MRYIITFCLLFCLTLNVGAQSKSQYKWVNDTFYNKNKPLFICKGKIEGKKSIYMLRNFNNKSLAFISFDEQDTVLKTVVSFPLNEIKFGVYFPKIKAITLIEAFVNHKLIENGEVNVDSVKAYCNERGIQLQRIERKKVARPDGNDSLLMVRAKAEKESRISFDIINPLAQSVTVRIGTTTNYRVIVVAAGKTSNESAHLTDSICLFDIHRQPVECRGLNKVVTSFKIKDKAAGFE